MSERPRSDVGSDSLLNQMQYRLLMSLAPTVPDYMITATAYASASKLKILLGSELLERIRGKDVLDFGCGVGDEAVEMAEVANSVFGLDIVEASLQVARAHAEALGVSERCTFGNRAPSTKVDAIISLDSFEHFGDPAAILAQMYELLRPGGQVLISFGPPWYHPLGGHLFSVFPWAHLIFSETALMRWRNNFRSDGARRFHEVEGGLNQMTIGRFKRLVRETRFRIVVLEPVPIRRLKLLSNALTREFTTSIVRCVLERPNAP